MKLFWSEVITTMFKRVVNFSNFFPTTYVPQYLLFIFLKKHAKKDTLSLVSGILFINIIGTFFKTSA